MLSNRRRRKRQRRRRAESRSIKLLGRRKSNLVRRAPKRGPRYVNEQGVTVVLSPERHFGLYTTLNHQRGMTIDLRANFVVDLDYHMIPLLNYMK